MAKLTYAQLLAEFEALKASVAPPAEASAHWKARDLACTNAKPCARTFRTTKGRDWHIANVKHA